MYVCIHIYNIDIYIYVYRRAKVGDSPLAHDEHIVKAGVDRGAGLVDRAQDRHVGLLCSHLQKVPTG